MNAAAARRPDSARWTHVTRREETEMVGRGRVVVDMPPASPRLLRALREQPGRKLGPRALARGGGLRRLGAERDGALDRPGAAPHGDLHLVAGRVGGDRGN